VAASTATQIQLANQIIARRLSVREAEKLVAKTAKETESAASPRKKANGVSRDLTRLEEALSDHLGTRVALKVGAKEKGQIVIDFHGWEHLNSLLERQGLSGVVDA
jgi:ParB family chromosome partitioning protein